MRHLVKGRKLNRTASHRIALKRNLAMSLIEHKSIKTTLPKAKELQGFIERLITQKLPGKLGKKMTNILIHDIAPTYSNRSGGYTRIIKLENRKNDNAQMSIIEFVALKAQTEMDEETNPPKDK